MLLGVFGKNSVTDDLSKCSIILTINSGLGKVPASISIDKMLSRIICNG